MYLNLFATAIDEMDEEDDVYQIDFNKIFDKDDIQLLDESLINGFEDYRVILMNAEHLLATKYNLNLDHNYFKVMRDLCGRMRVHMRQYGCQHECQMEF